MRRRRRALLVHLDLAAELAGQLLRSVHVVESLEDRVQGVVRVVRTNHLGCQVLDTNQLAHSAHHLVCFQSVPSGLWNQNHLGLTVMSFLLLPDCMLVEAVEVPQVLASHAVSLLLRLKGHGPLGQSIAHQPVAVPARHQRAVSIQAARLGGLARSVDANHHLLEVLDVHAAVHHLLRQRRVLVQSLHVPHRGVNQNLLLAAVAARELFLEGGQVRWVVQVQLP
mmetsp:Transcript_11873/g.22621  ORF Transcript_11873/g.22621 Transcript_11873/m.22621 type:complete len:224 (+) Transcript_11873:324-995(+)